MRLDTGSARTMPTSASLYMVYVNLRDVHKSRGHINDDSIALIKNRCEIDDSDDDYDNNDNIPTVIRDDDDYERQIK